MTFLCGKCYLFGELLGRKLEKTWNSLFSMWNVFYFSKKLREKKMLVPMWVLLNVPYYYFKGVQAINDNLCDSSLMRSCKLLHVFGLSLAKGEGIWM